MSLYRFTSRLHRQLAGHAQMNHQVKVLIEINNDPLPAAAHRRNPTADQDPLPGLLPPPTQTLLAHLDGSDAAANQGGHQLTDNSLNLWQLGHGNTRCESSRIHPFRS